MSLLQAEPIVGLREWAYDTRAGLKSVSGGFRWPVRRAAVARCECADPPAHEPPAPDGTCGIYALDPRAVRVTTTTATILYTWTDSHFLVCLREDPRPLIGLVALWGRVIRGNTGVYRAQFAYPLVLFSSPRAERWADWYGVPVIRPPRSGAELRQAVEQARQHLRPVAP